MPDHRLGDGLLIDDAAGAEGHHQAKPLPDQPLQNLQLHLAHQLDVDSRRASFQTDVELGIFLLQLAQLPQGRVGVRSLRQTQLIDKIRFSTGAVQPLSLQGPPPHRPAQPRHRHTPYPAQASSTEVNLAPE